MSLSEIQRDAVQMMRIQGILKFIPIDPRVAKTLIRARQFILEILRSCPTEDFR